MIDESLEDYLRDLFNKLMKQQQGTALNFKIAGGVIDFSKQGWLKVNYTDLSNKGVAFSRTPYISVVVTATEGTVKPPQIQLPRIKVNIDGVKEITFDINIPKMRHLNAPSISLPSIPQIPGISSIPRISKVRISKIQSPKLQRFPHLTAPTITNTYCFKYKGKEYCYNNRRDYFYNYTQYVFADTLRNKLGDWSLSFNVPVINVKITLGFNWMRDAIISAFVYVEKYLTATIGYLMDVLSGQELKEALQRSLDNIVANINTNVIDSANNSMQKLADSIVNEANKQISTIQDYINSIISDINSRVAKIVNDINSKVNDTNKALRHFKSSIQNGLNQMLEEITNEINSKIADAWNRQMEAIQSSILTLITQINERLNDVQEAIQNGVNISIDEFEKELEKSINLAIAQIWALLGLKEGIVFQPAVIRNVTSTGFEIYSTGKQTKAYYIAIGV